MFFFQGKKEKGNHPVHWCDMTNRSLLAKKCDSTWFYFYLLNIGPNKSFRQQWWWVPPHKHRYVHVMSPFWVNGHGKGSRISLHRLFKFLFFKHVFVITCVCVPFGCRLLQRLEDARHTVNKVWLWISETQHARGWISDEDWKRSVIGSREFQSSHRRIVPFQQPKLKKKKRSY